MSSMIAVQTAAYPVNGARSFLERKDFDLLALLGVVKVNALDAAGEASRVGRRQHAKTNDKQRFTSSSLPEKASRQVFWWMSVSRREPMIRL